MKAFYIDYEKNHFYTYQDLLKRINEQQIIKNYIFNNNPYEIFVQFISGIIHNAEIALLDYDMSEKELENIGLNLNQINRQFVVKPSYFDSIDQLLTKLKEKEETSNIVLYTSGTTGRPKKVEHTLKSLTRTVKTNVKYEQNIWGFAYNPTHFAGVQVFLQALLNKNTLVNLFTADTKNIVESLLKNQVTNLSGTPTFYRKIISFIKEPILTLKCLTFGGEKYDSEIIKPLRKIFPNAKIVNIYASTEAGALFTAKGDCFIIDESIRHFIKIDESGEMLIHKTILGKSEGIVFDEDWFHSGDIVQIVDDNSFRFVSRKSEMINVGGYKVNPHEVENCILELAAVKDVLVYGRKNRITGNIIAADIIIDNMDDKVLIEKLITDHLKKVLQSWKIPRIVKFVDNIETTRSGKKVRK